MYRSHPAARRDALPPLPLTVTCVGLAYLLTASWETVPRDGLTFLLGANAWLAGGSLYTPYVQGAPVWNLNLPHTAALFVPFALLPLAAGLALWQVLNLAAFAYSVWLVSRVVPPSSWWVVVAVLCSISCTHVQVAMGQMAGVLSLAATLGWLGLRQRRDWQAGIAIGVLVAVKPFFGLLALVLLRRPRALVACVAAVAVCIALGLALFGAGAYEAWWSRAAGVDWLGHPLNLSWTGWVARLTTSGDFWAALAPAAPWASPLSAIGTAALAAITLWTLWRTADTDASVALALVGGLVIGPTGWQYYGWLLTGPVWALLARGWHPPPVVWLLWVPWPLLIAGEASGVLSATLGSVYTIAALGIWYSLVRLCLRVSAPGSG